MGAMQARHSWNRISKRQLLLLALLVIGLYVLLPQIGSFQHSLSDIKRANKQQLLWAAVFAGLTYAAAAGTYYFLALKRLSYRRTVLVQVASMFANRLVPAGAGGIGVNYLYLRRAAHNQAQAITVVTVNNLMGFIGHSLLVVGLLLSHTTSVRFRIHLQSYWLVVVVAVVTGGWLALGLQSTLRKRVATEVRGIKTYILAYRRRLPKLLASLVTSVSLTLCNVLSLWFCVQAVGGKLNLVQVLLAFTLGVAVGTASPTPGGLGGLEAGVVAGLVAQHLGNSPALAAVLLFRLFSYWLPLVFGGAAFAYVNRRHYI
jgi:uncharacterized protein (TIRG00374 family)